MDTTLLLTLLYLPGVTPKAVERLVARRPQAAIGLDELPETIAAVFKPGDPGRAPGRRDISAAHSRARQTLEIASKAGIIVTHRWQKRYPPRLTKITTPPPLLFVRGNLDCLSGPRAITIVGTRIPTPYGAGRAAAVTERFAAHGFAVVSGLAVGCDTVAHRACLRSGGKTAAVLAHGLLRVYPSTNRRLADAIVDRGGCLVSEHPPGVKPRSAYFVWRNRIQSALGDGVVVIESGLRSGTMHTAAACLRQGKPLFCLQHPEKYHHHLQVRGNRRLLTRAGAMPLTGPGAVESAIERLLSLSA